MNKKSYNSVVITALIPLYLMLWACGSSDSGSGLPVVSITDTSANEATAGMTTMEFTVNLSTIANGNVNIDYSTSNGTATAGADYTTNSGILIIPAGTTSATISVDINGDTELEAGETIQIVLSNASSNVGTGTLNATGTIIDTFSDEFDNNLDLWSTLNPAEATAQLNAGQLEIIPNANSLWFNTDSGILLYKNITGDFSATAFVSVAKPANTGIPPNAVNLAGLMAHDPSSTTNTENYVHIAYGTVTNSNPVVETKTTVDSASSFSTEPWPDADGEIRICRVGSSFILLNRKTGGTWVTRATFTRPDLPSTLQVGAMAYSDANNDLRAKFDYVRITPVTSTADCGS